MTERALTDAIVPHPLRQFIPLLKGAALVATILGAIPTAMTAYHAWQYKIPFSQVSHRLGQYDLWVKNLDCNIEYKALLTSSGSKVDVGACPQSGDIAIKISAEDGKSTYEWIAYNQLQKPGEAKPVGIIDMIIGSARADSANRSVQLADAGMVVVCQALSKPTELVRIVKEGNKCFREKLSPLRGTVDARAEVPCETKCKEG